MSRPKPKEKPEARDDRDLVLTWAPFKPWERKYSTVALIHEPFHKLHEVRRHLVPCNRFDDVVP